LPCLIATLDGCRNTHTRRHQIFRQSKFSLHEVNMALLKIIGTMVFLAVVALSLMAVIDILRPRRSRVASAERAPDYAPARSSEGS
jgi:hypothetical protein